VKLRGRQKYIVGILLALVVNGITAYLLHSGGLYQSQAYVNDLLISSSKQSLDDRIAIVAIDDQSLKDFGRLGSWDRARYAQLIQFLKDAGAKVVAFDVLFDLPTQRDGLVAQAIAYAQSSAGGSAPMPVILAEDGDGERGKVPGQGVAYDQFLVPARDILAGRPLLANVTVQPDGAEVRHLPLRAVAADHPEQFAYLLPFAAVDAFLGRNVMQDAQTAANGIQAAGRFIPTDRSYRMLINFEGKPFAFPHYSFSKVVTGQVPAETFRDKLVFVGMMGATGLADDYPVPTSGGTKMWGVEIWANGAQNILTGKFVEPEGELSTNIFMVALAIAALIGFFARGILGWIGTAVVLLAYGGGAYLWTTQLLSSPPAAAQIIPLPNMVYVMANVLFSSLVLFIWFFIQEQRSRRAINQMFGKYVTPAVAKHLMAKQEQGELGLGGQRKTATVMFGDIRGFTTLSEGMEPEEVMAMLNRYFDRMVDIIVEHGGTISKFIGDNVMALFNLPDENDDHHALSAARAGYEIQEWIKVYKEEHPEEQAAFGFGISSGELVAGIMGSQDRMEYTVIGDPVREADELCATAAANEVAISESTYERIKNLGISVEDRGMVTIKGKTDQIHMFTIRGIEASLSQRKIEDILAKEAAAGER
jgi:adenylate cyclase